MAVYQVLHHPDLLSAPLCMAVAPEARGHVHRPEAGGADLMQQLVNAHGTSRQPGQQPGAAQSSQACPLEHLQQGATADSARPSPTDKSFPCSDLEPTTHAHALGDTPPLQDLQGDPSGEGLDSPRSDLGPTTHMHRLEDPQSAEIVREWQAYLQGHPPQGPASWMGAETLVHDILR